MKAGCVAGHALANIVIGFLLAAASLSPAWGGGDVVCPGADIRVEGAGDSRVAPICETAYRAVAFMRQHGIETVPPLRIKLVGELPRQHQVARLGQFNASTGRIRVLKLTACQRETRDEPSFGVSMTPELHRSFVAHEVAHAVAQANFATHAPSVEAHEYIAYTVQLSVMPQALRTLVLSGYSQPGFADESEINATYLALNPAAFAVKAYRHFNTLADPAAFYRRLLSGAFQPAGGWE